MTADAGTEAAAPLPSPEDLDARWALVLPHQDRLRRIAARRLACRDEVDDVVQEAMLRAVTFERLDTRFVGQFLTTVTVRLCADVQRDRVRQLRVGVRDALRSVEQNDPHDNLLDRAEARWLYGECLKLPPRESAVVLARASGLSVKETASSLGVGTKSAEAALTKARHRMRRAAQSAGVAAFGFLKRIRYAAPTGAVAATVTAATIGGVMVIGGDPVFTPPVRGAVPAASVPDSRIAPLVTVPEADPAGTAVRTATDVRAAAPPAVTKRPKPPKPPKPGTGAIKTPPNSPVQTRAAIKDEREDEPVQDTLVRCVGDALTVDPQHLLCDPEKEQ